MTTTTVTCRECGAMTEKKIGAKFCSKACQQKWNNDRISRALRELNAREPVDEKEKSGAAGGGGDHA